MGERSDSGTPPRQGGLKAFCRSCAIRGHTGDKHNDSHYAQARLRVQRYLQPQ
jgi:hypothetical protein